jgi:hypothetical protein
MTLPPCFTENMLVKCKYGYKKISNISTDDYVLTEDSTKCSQKKKCKEIPCWVKKTEEEIKKYDEVIKKSEEVVKKDETETSKEETIVTETYDNNRMKIFNILKNRNIGVTTYDEFKTKYFETQDKTDSFFNMLKEKKWIVSADLNDFYKTFACDLDWALNKIDVCMLEMIQPTKLNIDNVSPDYGKQVNIPQK